MKHIILCITLLCMAIGIHAQTKVMNLQQCIDMALANSYQVKAAAKGVEKAKNLIGTAWNVDKTEISLSQDPSSGGSTDNALSVSQSIEFPTVYIARRAQLKAELRAEDSKMEVVKANLVYQVKSIYYQMKYLRLKQYISFLFCFLKFHLQSLFVLSSFYYILLF